MYDSEETWCIGVSFINESLEPVVYPGVRSWSQERGEIRLTIIDETRELESYHNLKLHNVKVFEVMREPIKERK